MGLLGTFLHRVSMQVEVLGLTWYLRTQLRLGMWKGGIASNMGLANR